MSDEPVLSQEDAEGAAYFWRTGSWHTDWALQAALHEAKAAGASQGRTAERAEIRAKVQRLLDEWTANQDDQDHYYSAGCAFALRQVLVLIDKEDTPHE